jgi:hypothetical protein
MKGLLQKMGWRGKGKKGERGKGKGGKFNDKGQRTRD